ncbi:hypothetical protein EGW08_008691 [Elysia chlorotica]|uniref:Uncharacterized protein n=1 Tax=Elysia chlorotica TaxID=188477 RepID=A0A3S1A5T9_ELYCH|nr:hypothetical protein EGW08_008691 [Elysia chlorotica]
MRINCYSTALWRSKQRVEPEVDYNVIESENQYKPQPNGRSIYSNNIYRPTSNGNTKADHHNRDSNNSGIPRQKPELNRNLTTGTLNLGPVTDQSTPEDVSRGGEITWRTASIVLDGFLLRLYSLFLAVSSVVFIVLLMNG